MLMAYTANPSVLFYIFCNCVKLFLDIQLFFKYPHLLFILFMASVFIILFDNLTSIDCLEAWDTVQITRPELEWQPYKGCELVLRVRCGHAICKHIIE